MSKLIRLEPAPWPRTAGWLVPGDNCTALGYKIVTRAFCDLGILEVPNGSNRGTRLDGMAARAGSPLGSWWCAIWAGCVLADAGALVPAEFAATNNWKDHLLPGGPDATPQAGDAILYGVNGTAHHIGIVARAAEPSEGQRLMLSIEGNRAYAGTTSNNGVAVDIGPVMRTDIMGYYRPQAVA